VLRPGAAATGEELRAFAAERLARFKVPKAVELADTLPRTESGKLLRRELA
jgi:long-chain acyl-CoA synthetase